MRNHRSCGLRQEQHPKSIRHSLYNFIKPLKKMFWYNRMREHGRVIRKCPKGAFDCANRPSIIYSSKITLMKGKINICLRRIVFPPIPRDEAAQCSDLRTSGQQCMVRSGVNSILWEGAILYYKLGMFREGTQSTPQWHSIHLRLSI